MSRRDPAAERHRLAVERARADRAGRDAPVPPRFRGRRSATPGEWVRDSPHLRAQRDADPVGAVKAAQETYRHLKRLGLLDEVTRRVLTRDYESAIRTAYRRGLKSEVVNASWPPLPDPDDDDGAVVDAEVVEP